MLNSPLQVTFTSLLFSSYSVVRFYRLVWILWPCLHVAFDLFKYKCIFALCALSMCCPWTSWFQGHESHHIFSLTVSKEDIRLNVFLPNRASFALSLCYPKTSWLQGHESCHISNLALARCVSFRFVCSFKGFPHNYVMFTGAYPIRVWNQEKILFRR